jgi:hypothetical protein
MNDQVSDARTDESAPAVMEPEALEPTALAEDEVIVHDGQPLEWTGIPISADVTDLVAFREALTAEGVEVGSLGITDGRLHTYDDQGRKADFPSDQIEQIEQLLASYVPPPPALSKNDVLLSLLDGLEPGDEATEVLVLVQQEMLRP